MVQALDLQKKSIQKYIWRETLAQEFGNNTGGTNQKSELYAYENRK